VAYMQHWSIVVIFKKKGLAKAEIEKFTNFDWDDSADEENEEDEVENMDRIIE
ncbi:unnamed protein product, partial [Ceratitis capitata]